MHFFVCKTLFNANYCPLIVIIITGILFGFNLFATNNIISFQDLSFDVIAIDCNDSRVEHNL
jgi:hypothetical protein